MNQRQSKILRKTLSETETVIENGALWLTETERKWGKERRKDECLNWQQTPQILEGF